MCSPCHTCVSFRDGTLLATCSSDGLSRLWDFRTGRLLRTLLDTECSAPITSLHFCPNGRYLLEAVLQENALVRVWDWQQLEGTVVRRLHGHQNSTYSVPARFVYGAWAASASEDGRVVLWHINSGKVRLSTVMRRDRQQRLPAVSLVLVVPPGVPAAASWQVMRGPCTFLITKFLV